MSNIFRQNQDVNEHPNRNNFDLFYQNHMSMKAGVIYPFMCKPCVPGDSFRINTAVGIKAMPLPFPVQSRMRASISYFMVPNRILWDEWKDWLSGVTAMNGENIVHPYISQPREFFKTCSLADYLDIPTTVFSYEDFYTDLEFIQHGGYIVNESNQITETYQSWNFFYSRINEFKNNTFIYPMGQNMAVDLVNGYHVFPNVPQYFLFGAAWKFYSSITHLRVSNADSPYTLFASGLEYVLYVGGINDRYNSSYNTFLGKFVLSVDGNNQLVFDLSSAEVQDKINAMLLHFNKENPCNIFVMRVLTVSNPDEVITLDASILGHNQYVGSILTKAYERLDYSHSKLDTFSGENPPIRISALPFRAYEAVYNAYFRDSHGVQDFVVNGKHIFNKFVTNSGSGADSTNYELKLRNWESDFLTSAMPSPQAATAPLVGMSALGNISVTDEDGIVTNATARLAADGETIVGLTIHNPADSVTNTQTLTQAAIAAAGMSINDFRSVNAFQRFLETTLRKGYRYKDFIEGHFGDGPNAAEVDMPIYLGGFNQDFNVTQVTQTSSSTSDSPLGTYAGQMNAFGGSNHSITHYCDDYGWILGVVTIVPDPAYSQLLPKHFLASDPLDYYFPEFSQLGMQPITYREVAPLQCDIENKNLMDTFGYQRPNYDMIQYTDQVHGTFRTELNNLLINRVFAGRPELGDEFLTIKPEETNQIFAYTAPDADNFIGQIVVDCKAKRPIPRINIPSLGR